MVSLKAFYTQLATRLENGENLAVATIARRLGSAPRNQGARAAIDSDGKILGTIGGGLLEARAQEAGAQAVGDGRIRHLKIRLDSKELAESGMICGGSVDILVSPWGAVDAPVARALLELFLANGRAALITSWDQTGTPTGAGLLEGAKWTGPGAPGEKIAEAAGKALQQGKPVLVGSPDGEGFLAEPIEREKSPLIVLGAGHVGKALTEVAAIAGFSVTAVDDREEFADPEKLPRADRVVCEPFPGVLSRIGADETTFIVICTRGHLSDTDCVVDAMKTPSPYVGMIGSRRKKGMIIKKLLDSGIPEERLTALYTPVGLEIGAETPEEIAISITGEMIKLKRE